MHIDLSKLHIHSVQVDIEENYDYQPWVTKDSRPRTVRIIMKVEDLHNGDIIEIQQIDMIPSKVILTPANERRLIRSLVQKAVLHEIDECLFIDGKRTKDPHPEHPEWAEKTGSVAL